MHIYINPFMHKFPRIYIHSKNLSTVILDTLLLSDILYGIIIYLIIKLKIKFLYLNQFQHCSICLTLFLEIITKENVG